MDENEEDLFCKPFTEGGAPLTGFVARPLLLLLVSREGGGGPLGGPLGGGPRGGPLGGGGPLGLVFSKFRTMSFKEEPLLLEALEILLLLVVFVGGGRVGGNKEAL